MLKSYFGNIYTNTAVVTPFNHIVITNFDRVIVLCFAKPRKAKSKVKKLPNKKKSPALAKTIAELDKENTVPPYISHGIKIDGITLSYRGVLKVLKNF